MFDRPRTTYLLCRSIGRSRIHAALQALKAWWLRPRAAAMLPFQGRGEPGSTNARRDLASTDKPQEPEGEKK